MHILHRVHREDVNYFHSPPKTFTSSFFSRRSIIIIIIIILLILLLPSSLVTTPSFAGWSRSTLYYYNIRSTSGPFKLHNTPRPNVYIIITDTLLYTQTRL